MCVNEITVSHTHLNKPLLLANRMIWLSDGGGTQKPRHDDRLGQYSRVTLGSLWTYVVYAKTICSKHIPIVGVQTRVPAIYD